MGTRRFSFVEGEYFHIYNRGNSKQSIFLDKFDYERFMMLLFISNSKTPFKLYFIKNPYKDFEREQQLVSIGAYCLMPNHFHILLTPLVENGVSLFMKKITTGYSMYFNNKYDRTGILFEGRFKAELADSDQYLKYLFSYIHLNPIKLIQSSWKEEGIKNPKVAMKYLDEYTYSSYSDYDSKIRLENKILNREAFPEYFKSSGDFRAEILEWINYNTKI